MTERSLRIGVTCFPTYGGSGVIASEIGMAMARRGHRVHFISSDIPRRLNRFQENIFFHEVELTDYPVFRSPPYTLGLTSKMVEVSSSEKLDILHVHYAIPHATSAFLAKQILKEAAPKVISTLHGTDITLVGNSRSYLPITRFSIVQSDAVTAPSQALRNATYDKLNVPSDTVIDVIPNFVDIERFKPAVNEKPWYARLHKRDEPLLVHVSNFRKVKRPLDVVKIFAALATDLPVRLVLVGDGPERSAAEELARELKIDSRVSFLGKLEDFVDVLQQATLFLLPSETESFGLAALEAMSCGIPVIATNVGGLPEVVPDGRAGYLSDIGDVEKMANDARRLLIDPSLYRSFAAEARNLAVTNYNSDTVTKRYEDYYFEVLRRTS